MSSDLYTAISSFVSNSWRFFTQITIPGTEITMGHLAIGLAIVPLALRFLSIMLNVQLGDPPDTGYGNPKSKSLTISSKRELDVR